MEFYYSPKSAAYAVHILLEEVDATYNLHLIDLKNSNQKEKSYLRINPKARVPSLVTKDGVLTETPAILTYIAQLYSSKDFLPKTVFGFAKVQAFNTYLASTVHVAHAHKHRGYRWTDDEKSQKFMSKKVRENMSDCAEMIENHFFIGPWVMGKQYTICDPYLALVYRWFGDDGVNLERFPKLKIHNTNMNLRPAVKRVAAFH